MKTNSLRPLITAFALIGGLLLADSARAAVSGINTPAGSSAAIQFNDTTSLNPSFFPGITSVNPTVSPWTGAIHTLPLTTDPVTFDFARGDITASVVLGNYSIALNNVVLNQINPNTGFAHLNFQFSVEFQLDAAGLSSQPTISPIFSVNGTVQNPAGSFAAIKGFIDYYGVNSAGTYSVLETVNYNALYNTPGNFSALVAGVPVNGSTPNLVPNTTLTLVGNIDFMVDPASINVQTVVPEPGSSSLLLGFAALSGLLWRRRSAS